MGAPDPGMNLYSDAPTLLIFGLSCSPRREGPLGDDDSQKLLPWRGNRTPLRDAANLRLIIKSRLYSKDHLLRCGYSGASSCRAWMAVAQFRVADSGTCERRALGEHKIESPRKMSSRSPAAILFDIDGTLVDDDRAVFLALTSFHATHGPELGLSLEDLVARWKELLNLHFARYLAGDVSMQEQIRARALDLFAPSKPNLSPAAADRLFATYEGHYRTSWSAYPDVLPALAALSGFVLAVLSNGDHAQQTQKLQRCGLTTYFSGIFVSSEIECAKPVPDAFLSACRRLGIPPRRCVFVGDSVETDARASASAGLISVWLDRTGSRIDPGPDVQVIHSLAELPALMGTRTD